MKNRMSVLKITFITSCIFLLGACSTQEAEEPSKQMLLSSKLLPEQIAENFYKELPEKEIRYVSEAYRSMTYQEAAEFIDARYNIDISEGVSPNAALQRKEILHETNDMVFAEQGQSFTSVDIAKSAAIYKELLQSGKYTELAGNQGQANRVTCSNGSWFPTKSIGYILSGVSLEWPFSFGGQVNFGGNSNDCDYLFISNRYNIYYKANRLVGKTSGTQFVLTYNNSTSNPAREPGVSSSEARLEFGAGKDRVNLAYGYINATNRFASEIKVELVKR